MKVSEPGLAFYGGMYAVVHFSFVLRVTLMECAFSQETYQWFCEELSGGCEDLVSILNPGDPQA